jgi:hypothetical protein
MRTKVWLESLKGRDHSCDVEVDERKILKLTLGKEGMNWINLAQDWKGDGNCEHGN